MLTCLCSWLTACGKITDPVVFYCPGTVTSYVSPFLNNAGGLSGTVVTTVLHRTTLSATYSSAIYADTLI